MVKMEQSQPVDKEPWPFSTIIISIRGKEGKGKGNLGRVREKASRNYKASADATPIGRDDVTLSDPPEPSGKHVVIRIELPLMYYPTPVFVINNELIVGHSSCFIHFST